MNGRDLQMQQMQGAQAQQDACSARGFASGNNLTAFESPKMREVRSAAVALKAAREAHRAARAAYDAAYVANERAEDAAGSAEHTWRRAVEELRKELEAAEPA